ncbi:homoserine O-acetyltransferase family protein [Mucilaginibacter auburnensis]|uniref:Homoserine O-acetyltransferase n=1 Tax=Mucilaginibacter auburnensis TaxID=1457233 RepID=A0A2H9VM41_9SPHI|nr:homoserine O-acetyltransferase [Mucilaginibacter auburnensis]PJJ79409.1 homoserine O-acetyltransferase [Mucilaginibacter auburnensis]
MSIHLYKHSQPFTLESGEILHELEIGYHTYGTLNEKGDNVIWVCHALTANSDVLDWWKGLFGENDYFNPADHFIVCANVLSSPYGTSSPLSINPQTGQPYYLSFPKVNIRDMANAHCLLAAHLGVTQIEICIGGSLGGQQALEWAIIQPYLIKNLIAIATNARHSPWGIAFNESQRLALLADDTFLPGSPDGGRKGLKAARSMALLSYRTYKTYDISQQEESDAVCDDFRASSYQCYQGDKLVNRFNAYSYWYLSKAMDSHNVGRGRGGVENALKVIKSRTLVIGIRSDVLFPINEQEYLAKHIPGASFVELDSFYGHDGFLIETDALTKIITSFYQKDVKGNNIQLQQTL